MINFLKNFLSNEKSPEEQALLAKNTLDKKHDVLTVEGYAMGDDEEEAEGCNTNTGGCGGCGCRS